MVEVVRAYSSRYDLADDLARAVRVVREGKIDWAGGTRSVRSVSRRPALIPVRDRLSETELAALVRDFDAGTAKHVLAERYGISLSSVKRVLRRAADF